MNIVFVLFFHAASTLIGLCFGLAFHEWFFTPAYWAELGAARPLGVIPIIITLVVWGIVMIYTCVGPFSGDFAPEAEAKATPHVMGSLCFTQFAAAIAVQAYAQPLDMASPMVALWLLPMIAILYATYSTWRFPAN